MSSSITRKRLNFWQKTLVGCGVVLVLFGGCQAKWALDHPAPLGRSVESVTARLANALPLGTSIDSVMKYLTAVGAQPMQADSLIHVREHNAGLPLPFPEDISIDFLFDGARRLTKTNVRAIVLAP
jgi:hypothetical protein